MDAKFKIEYDNQPNEVVDIISSRLKEFGLTIKVADEDDGVMIYEVVKIILDIKYKFFWDGIFSNWYPSEFTVDGIEFNCGEQYMMYQKAVVFLDMETAEKILKEPVPRKQKQLGRAVKNFNPKTWNEISY